MSRPGGTDEPDALKFTVSRTLGSVGDTTKVATGLLADTTVKVIGALVTAAPRSSVTVNVVW